MAAKPLEDTMTEYSYDEDGVACATIQQSYDGCDANSMWAPELVSFKEKASRPRLAFVHTLVDGDGYSIIGSITINSEHRCESQIIWLPAHIIDPYFNTTGNAPHLAPEARLAKILAQHRTVRKEFWAGPEDIALRAIAEKEPIVFNEQITGIPGFVSTLEYVPGTHMADTGRVFLLYIYSARQRFAAKQVGFDSRCERYHGDGAIRAVHLRGISRINIGTKDHDRFCVTHVHTPFCLWFYDYQIWIKKSCYE